MLEEPKKKENWWKRLWKDPVGSKLIAGLIGAITLFLWGLIQSWTKDISIGEGIQNVLTYQIKLWLILSLIVLFSVSRLLFLKYKRSKVKPDFDKDEAVGNFKFHQLLTILSTKRIQHPALSYGMALPTGTEPVLLLNAFLDYKEDFNKGVKEGVGTPYVSKVLGPALMNYDLVYLADEYHPSLHLAKEQVWRITDAGNQFYILYEKFKLSNP